MIRHAATLLLAIALAGGEADPVGEQPVVVVDGEAVTLRHLEDEMLQKEGIDLLMDLVQRSLVKTEWEKLPTDATLVQVGRLRITREVLAAELLRQDAAKVREDMIDLVLVEHALRKEGILLTEIVLDNELKRIEKAFRRRLVESGQPAITFAEYLEQTEGLTIAEFKAQAAFRMLTGLHLLVFRHTEIPEAELKRFYLNKPGRFSRDEQLDLSMIHIPFDERVRRGDPLAKEGPRGVLKFIHQQLAAGKTTFAAQFMNFGRGHDPDAREDGRIGWVGPDGRRAQVGSKQIPKYLMQILMATNREDLPALIKPLETEEGVYLFKLHGHRPAFRPKFEEAKDLVREAMIEDGLKDYTNKMRARLRKQSAIEYQDLPPLLRAREERVRKRREADEAAAEKKAAAKAPVEEKAPKPE